MKRHKIQAPALLLFCLALPCNAAWISEIQPLPRFLNLPTATEPALIPPLIEISGMTGRSQAELVILNASSVPTRHGTILQVITLAAGPDIRLITPGPWPERVFPFGDTTTGAMTKPTGDTALNLAGSRTILLFDGPTGLVPHSGTITDAWPTLPDVTLLDTVTYGQPTQTATLLDETLQPASPGQIIARPSMLTGDPWPDLYLIGDPDPNGFLTGISPVFQLNPGLANVTWAAATTPEPATAIALLLGLAMAFQRPSYPSRTHTK